MPDYYDAPDALAPAGGPTPAPKSCPRYADHHGECPRDCGCGCHAKSNVRPLCQYCASCGPVNEGNARCLVRNVGIRATDVACTLFSKPAPGGSHGC